LQPIDEEQQITRSDKGIISLINTETATPNNEEVTNRVNQPQIGPKHTIILPFGNNFKKSHTKTADSSLTSSVSIPQSASLTKMSKRVQSTVAISSIMN